MPTHNSAKLKLAAVQASSVWLDRQATISKACDLIAEAGEAGAHIIAFPEGFVPGHPSWFHYQPASRPKSVEMSIRLLDQALEIPGPDVDRLRSAAAKAKVVAVIGVAEKLPGTTGTIYNSQLVIDSTGEVVGKHQKLVATMTERLVHSPGRAETQRTFPTSIGEVSALICGENSNPFAVAMISTKYPLVHVASWPSHVSPGSIGVREISSLTGRGVARSLGSFVINASGINSEDMISDIAIDERDREFLRDPSMNGGASIIGPAGQILAGPMPGNEEGILYADVDVVSSARARLVSDFAGHYNRPDVFNLTVNNTPSNLVTTIGHESGTPLVDEPSVPGTRQREHTVHQPFMERDPNQGSLDIADEPNQPMRRTE